MDPVLAVPATAMRLALSAWSGSSSDGGGGEAQGSQGFQVVGPIHLDGLSTALLTLLPYVILVVLLRVAFSHARELRSHFPESSMLVIVGLALGLALIASGVEQDPFEVDPEVFFLILVPPIMFEAGYYLNQAAFFNALHSILLFAVVGTLVNSLLVGGVLYAFGVLNDGHFFNTELSFANSLAFGALISAVDPVAVLAVFEETRVNERLHMLVFGESVLNDAVSIVLFQLFSSLDDLSPSELNAALPFLAILKFLYVSFAGLAIGVVGALLMAYVTKFTVTLQHTEPLLIVTFAMLIFAVAEVVGASGIVAVLFAGIFMARYCEPNIAKKSHTALKSILKIFAGLSDMLIFSVLGVAAAYHMVLGTTEHAHLRWNTAFILLSLLTVLAVRPLIVVALSALHNRIEFHQIPLRAQIVLSWGGLRGAIALVLVFTFPRGNPVASMFITATVVIILFTIFVLGSLIKPMLKFLSVPLKCDTEDVARRVLPRGIDLMTEGIGSVIGMRHHHRIATLALRVDHWLQHRLLRRLNEPERDLVTTLRKLRARRLEAVIAAKERNQEFISPEEYVDLEQKYQRLMNSDSINLVRVVRHKVRHPEEFRAGDWAYDDSADQRYNAQVKAREMKQRLRTLATHSASMSSLPVSGQLSAPTTLRHADTDSALVMPSPLRAAMHSRTLSLSGMSSADAQVDVETMRFGKRRKPVLPAQQFHEAARQLRQSRGVVPTRHRMADHTASTSVMDHQRNILDRFLEHALNEGDHVVKTAPASPAGVSLSRRLSSTSAVSSTSVASAGSSSSLSVPIGASVGAASTRSSAGHRSPRSEIVSPSLMPRVGAAVSPSTTAQSAAVAVPPSQLPASSWAAADADAADASDAAAPHPLNPVRVLLTEVPDVMDTKPDSAHHGLWPL